MPTEGQGLVSDSYEEEGVGEDVIIPRDNCKDRQIWKWGCSFQNLNRGLTYPSLMGSFYEFREVLHLPLGVWILEQNPTDIFATEIHFMG